MKKKSGNYASKEEAQYSYYLDELEEAGFIREYLYEPVSIPLSEPIDRLRKHSYTPDFVVVWDRKAEGLFYRPYGVPKPSYLPVGQVLPDNTIVSYVEIKGARDFKNMERLAKLNIKWAHQKFSLYINMIKPLHDKGLFARTFTPQLTIDDKVTRGIRKGQFRYKWEPVVLQDYLNAS